MHRPTRFSSFGSRNKLRTHRPGGRAGPVPTVGRHPSPHSRKTTEIRVPRPGDEGRPRVPRTRKGPTSPSHTPSPVPPLKPWFLNPPKNLLLRIGQGPYDDRAASGRERNVTTPKDRPGSRGPVREGCPRLPRLGR